MKYFVICFLAFAMCDAKSQTCNIGLDQIIVNPGNVTDQTGWSTSSSQIRGTMITADKSGSATKVGVVVGWGATSIKACVYSNTAGEPHLLLGQSATLASPFGIPLGMLDTVYADILVPFPVVLGQTYWPGVKQQGDSNFNLLHNPNGDGTSFRIGSPWANTFNPDLSALPVIVSPGIYAVFLVIEDCVIPTFGCMDAVACNYDMDADIDNGSCEYLTCAGCMDAVACNYDVDATISAICHYSGNDKNGDGNITIADFMILLGYFEESSPCMNIVSDDVITTNDIITFLTFLPS